MMTQRRTLLTSKEQEYEVMNFVKVISEELHYLKLETKLERKCLNAALLGG